MSNKDNELVEKLDAIITDCFTAWNSCREPNTCKRILAIRDNLEGMKAALQTEPSVSVNGEMDNAAAQMLQAIEEAYPEGGMPDWMIKPYWSLREAWQAITNATSAKPTEAK